MGTEAVILKCVITLLFMKVKYFYSTGSLVQKLNTKPQDPSDPSFSGNKVCALFKTFHIYLEGKSVHFFFLNCILKTCDKINK